MSLRKRLTSRVSVKLLGSVLLAILVVAAALTGTAIFIIRNSYMDFYSQNVLLTNRLVASQISGDELLPYIERLKGDPVLYAQQEGYMATNDLLFSLEEMGEAGTQTQEYANGKRQQQAFKQQMQHLKDEQYYEIQEQLNDLRRVSGARYLYIFADTGVPDAYTYIFDAVLPEEAGDIDRDDYGTAYYTYDFVGAEEVLETGQQMKQAIYEHNEVYGTLYYVYSPIYDSAGNVVALVGTDIDMHEMHLQLEQVLWINVAVVVLISAVVVAFLFAMLRSIIVRPLGQLTAISAKAARGEDVPALPEKLLQRNDEIGTLGRALYEMIGVTGNMIDNTQRVLESVLLGRMDMRSDPSELEGSYRRIAQQMNSTLDVISLYFDSIPEALCIVNNNMELVYCNLRHIETFHHILVRDLAARALDVAADLDAHQLSALLHQRADTDAHIATVRMLSPTGEERSYSLLARRLVLENRTTGTLLIASDITGLVQATERAEAANRAKSEFLSRASHELRTPLNVIIGLAKLGVRTPDLDAQTQENYRRIADASYHLLHIISDVLDMSRMEAGKLEIKPEPMSLRRTVRECYEMIQVTAGEKDVRLTMSYDDGIPPWLLGDDARIRQILLNLLSNAVKFTDRGGQVDIIATRLRQEGADTWIRLSVVDNGIGMTEEFQQRIFLPFEQAEQYLQRNYEGNGLGLSISYTLAQLMGGDMQVHSTLGEGSRFDFDLPMAPAEPPEAIQAEENDEAAPSLNGQRMLLVDDIEINREIVVQLFDGSGMFIDEASDGEEALRMFSESAEGFYDIILMDVQMPRMNGYEATRQIRVLPRADAGRTPIIAMTANALKEDVEHALQAGMTDHLAKPLDFAQCEEMVRKYAGRQKGEEQR